MKHSCEDMSRLVSAGLERKLSLKEKLLMNVHFIMCAACRHYANNMVKLRQVLLLNLNKRLSDENVELPHDKRKSIASQLCDL